MPTTSKKEQVKRTAKTPFTLPERTVTLKVINKVNAPHIQESNGSTEGVMMMGTSLGYGLERKHNGFVNPFKIYGELYGEDPLEVQDVLEELLDLDPGALKTTLVTNDQLNTSLWCTDQFKVNAYKQTQKLDSADVHLDLSNAADFAVYLAALGSWQCANSWEERFEKTYYLMAVYDATADQNKEIDAVTREAEIMAHLLELNRKGDTKALHVIYEMLRVNSPYQPSTVLSSKSKTSAFFFELTGASKHRTRAVVKTLHELIQFDPAQIGMYSTALRAREKGLISQPTRNRFMYQGQEIGATLLEAANWLLKDENQALALAANE